MSPAVVYVLRALGATCLKTTLIRRRGRWVLCYGRLHLRWAPVPLVWLSLRRCYDYGTLP